MNTENKSNRTTRKDVATDRRKDVATDRRKDVAMQRLYGGYPHN